MKKLILVAVFCFLMVPQAMAGDAFKDLYKAVKKLEMAAESGIDIRTFNNLLVDAKTELELFSPEAAHKNVLPKIETAVFAYSIIVKLYNSMYDDTACMDTELHKKAFEVFPALKTWKWGETGVGASGSYSKLRDCYLVSDLGFSASWMPCLLNEAMIALRDAKNIYLKK